MTRLRIESATAVDDRHVRVRWTDGLEGVVDFGDLIERGGVFAALRDPETFRGVQITEFGDTIVWHGPGDLELDICPDVLRAKVDPEVRARIEEQERAWTSRPAAE